MANSVYPAGGWLPQGAHLEQRWNDQGRDFATNWAGPVQAPGNGACLLVPANGVFPSGFGPAYPVVRIDTGPWAGHQYYIGHTSARVSPGEHFSFGHVLSVADQGHNHSGTTGGWVELGEWFPGSGPGPVSSTHWFDGLIDRPLVISVPDPPLHIGDSGWRVVGMTANLAACGWLKHFQWKFDSQVHGAVVAFKNFHRIPMPPITPGKPQADRGIVDARTDAVIQHSADLCKKTKKKEHKQ